MTNTVEDFWTLTLEYEIDTIVSLNEIVQDDQVSRFYLGSKTELSTFLANPQGTALVLW
jgi:hypothetical protein